MVVLWSSENLHPDNTAFWIQGLSYGQCRYIVHETIIMFCLDKMQGEVALSVDPTRYSQGLHMQLKYTMNQNLKVRQSQNDFFKPTFFPKQIDLIV